MSRAWRFLVPPPSKITIAAPSFPNYTRKPGPKLIRDSNTPPPTPFTLEKFPCSIRVIAVRTRAAAGSSRSSSHCPKGLFPSRPT